LAIATVQNAVVTLERDRDAVHVEVQYRLNAVTNATSPHDFRRAGS
jgi:hypothetical protein